MIHLRFSCIFLLIIIHFSIPIPSSHIVLAQADASSHDVPDQCMRERCLVLLVSLQPLEEGKVCDRRALALVFVGITAMAWFG